jgi:hypothetical protein
MDAAGLYRGSGIKNPRDRVFRGFLLFINKALLEQFGDE